MNIPTEHHNLAADCAKAYKQGQSDLSPIQTLTLMWGKTSQTLSDRFRGSKKDTGNIAGSKQVGSQNSEPVLWCYEYVTEA